VCARHKRKRRPFPCALKWQQSCLSSSS
jgi:hypothetical protein